MPHRHILLGTLLATALMITVKGALACTYLPYEKSSTVRGEQCAIEYRDRGHIGPVGLREAEDIGSGVVFQRYYGQFNSMMVVSNCTSGQALILGPLDVFAENCVITTAAEIATLDSAVAAAPLTKAERKVRRDGPLGRIDLVAMQAEFLPQVKDAAIVSLKSRIKISAGEENPRHAFDLGCGCKLYYPNSAGAKS